MQLLERTILETSGRANLVVASYLGLIGIIVYIVSSLVTVGLFVHGLYKVT